jgi:glycosyltransferase involved in cell wall biosynthesis
MLVNDGHKVDVAFNIDKEPRQEILDMGCKVHVVPFQRSPISRHNLVACRVLAGILRSEKYDLVHTHTPVASAYVRLACKGLKDIRVFYTAHGFHFYKGAPIKNWLAFYPIEKWLSRYTDTLITINKEDYNRAKGSFRAKRVEYLPGVGLDVKRFANTVVDKNEKRRELGVPEDASLVLSVGELNRNKNHEAIIRALSQLSDPKVHYVICGRGPLDRYLKELARKLEIAENVHFLGLRYDIAEICKASDVFVFPSFREGLSVALMEAMAAGLPVVCTAIRGNVDLIEDQRGGFLLKPEDFDGFANALQRLLLSSELRRKFGEINKTKIGRYSRGNVLGDLARVYAIK